MGGNPGPPGHPGPMVSTSQLVPTSKCVPQNDVHLIERHWSCYHTNTSHLTFFSPDFDFQGEPGSDGAAGKDVSNAWVWCLSPLKCNPCGDKYISFCRWIFLSWVWQGVAGLPGENGQPGQKVSADSGWESILCERMCVLPRPGINHPLPLQTIWMHRDASFFFCSF